MRICIIVTSATTLYYLYRKQFAFLASRGFEITAISAPGEEAELLRGEPVRVVAIPMAREPRPLRDLASLLRLWWFLLRNRFDLVHVSTPKASLLGALAARLSGHRRLIFTLRGRAYENDTGLRRRVLAGMDALVCCLAARVNPICSELGQQMVQEGLCDAAKIKVLAHGSSNGIDVVRFSRTPQIIEQAQAIRRQFAIPENACVILCIGRIRREKGINELIQAFGELAPRYPDVHLLLVGTYEDADPVTPQTRQAIEQHPRVHLLPWQKDPAAAYAASDIVAFPTYREGFGNVALEASAMELPVVASNIMGCRESVAENQSGLLVPPADPAALADALQRLIDDPALRNRLGKQGRARVEQLFRQEVIWHALEQQYREILDR